MKCASTTGPQSTSAAQGAAGRPPSPDAPGCAWGVRTSVGPHAANRPPPVQVSSVWTAAGSGWQRPPLSGAGLQPHRQ